MESSSSFLPPNKIAIVHEWFSSKANGGAEKVVKAIDKKISSKGSKADLFSLIDTESHRHDSWLFGREINTSFIQKLPFGPSNVQTFLPLLPLAIEQFDVSSYDLILSSSHLVAKGIITSPDQLHISYVHSPARYAWDQMHIYLSRSNIVKSGFGPLVRYNLHKFRLWDQLSALRVDFLFANSRFTSRRIEKYWGRTSEVIHPPVNLDRFVHSNERNDFYLALGRLVPNKRFDLVVKAFNTLGLPLLLVGDGPEKKYLHKIAGPNIQFLGFQSDKDVVELMSRCRAFVYAGIEDFGIAPVEAMASGAPVIGFAKGGLLDTVRCFSKVDSEATGLLFKEQTVKSLVDALLWFEEKKLWRDFPSEVLRSWSNNFSEEAFSIRFENALTKAWDLHKKSSYSASKDPKAIPGFRFGN